jgi:hypothetical protein
VRHLQPPPRPRPRHLHLHVSKLLCFFFPLLPLILVKSCMLSSRLIFFQTKDLRLF